MLPLWQTPHAFGLIPIEGDPAPLPPMQVSTFGPIVGDLAALAEPTYETVVGLGRRLGFEWLVSLVEIDRLEGIAEPALASFLRDRYALRPGFAPNPFGVRAGELVHQRPRAIPKQVLSEFVAREAGRLKYIGSVLGALAGPLLATAGGDPKPGHRQQQRAAELLNALASPVPVRRFYDASNSTSVYCSVPENLYARALLELVELYNDTPALAICARCNRLFVPQRKTEKYCRRYIWAAGETIAGCIFDDRPTATRAQLNSEARRREYKRLQMRVSRLAHNLGPRAASTMRARAEFEQWKRDHPVDRGRRPTPMPPDLLSEP